MLAVKYEGKCVPPNMCMVIQYMSVLLFPEWKLQQLSITQMHNQETNSNNSMTRTVFPVSMSLSRKLP